MKDLKVIRFAKVLPTTKTEEAYQALDALYVSDEDISLDIRVKGDRIVALYQDIIVASYQRRLSKRFHKAVLNAIIEANPTLTGHVIAHNDKGIKMLLDYEGAYSDYESKIRATSPDLLTETDEDEGVISFEEPIVTEPTMSETPVSVCEVAVEPETTSENEQTPIQKCINALVKKGINTLETLTDIVATLQYDYAINEPMVLEVLGSMRAYPDELRDFIPRKPKYLYKDVQGLMPEMVSRVNKKRHLLLDGGAATGKNTSATTLMWIFQRPFFEISMSKQTNRFDLMGDQTLTYNCITPEIKAIDSTQSTNAQISTHFENLTNVFTAMNQRGQQVTFNKGLYAIAMEMGAGVCLDEINTTSPGLVSFLNSTLDTRGVMNIPGAECIKADDNFIAIGTMNHGYVGTGSLNEALSTRFTHVLMDYPDDIRSILLINVPTAKRKEIDTVNNLYLGLKKMVESSERPLPDTIINIRGFISALKSCRDTSLKSALMMDIANCIKVPLHRDAVRNAINTIVGA